MNFSSLSRGDRIALIAGAVVAITAVLSIAYEWGVIMVVSLLAGLLAVAVVLQPQLMPATKLPATKGVLLLGAGAAATLVNALTAFDWLGWITRNLLTFDAIQFLTGLVAAVALLYAGWMAFQAERGTGTAAAGSSTPPEAPAAPTS